MEMVEIRASFLAGVMGRILMSSIEADAFLALEF